MYIWSCATRKALGRCVGDVQCSDWTCDLVELSTVGRITASKNVRCRLDHLQSGDSYPCTFHYHWKHTHGTRGDYSSCRTRRVVSWVPWEGKLPCPILYWGVWASSMGPETRAPAQSLPRRLHGHTVLAWDTPRCKYFLTVFVLSSFAKWLFIHIHGSLLKKPICDNVETLIQMAHKSIHFCTKMVRYSIVLRMNKGLEYSSRVEHSHSMSEVLGSVPSIAK